MRKIADDHIEYINICSWTAVESAIEMLFISLSIMTLFLYIEKIFVELHTSLLSFFTLRKSQKSDTDDIFHEINKTNKTFASNESQWTSTTVVNQEAFESESISLHSIVMTNHLKWN